jgi:hypothetical protein
MKYLLTTEQQQERDDETARDMTGYCLVTVLGNDPETFERIMQHLHERSGSVE